MANPTLLDFQGIYDVNRQFGFRLATKLELKQGLRLAESLIGQELASEEVIWKLQEYSKVTAWVYGHPIEGIHFLVPLTVQGELAVREGRFNPANPDFQHCAREGDVCAGVYVGAYAGSTKNARRSIMQGAAIIRVQCFGHSPCFANAATGDGARSMISLGFGPMSDEPGALWWQAAISGDKVTAA